jgi:hypothetical protein
MKYLFILNGAPYGCMNILTEWTAWADRVLVF